MSIEEELIAQWILREAAAEQIIRHDGEGYVFDGDRNEYWVEVTVLRKGAVDDRSNQGDVN